MGFSLGIIPMVTKLPNTNYTSLNKESPGCYDCVGGGLVEVAFHKT